MPVERPANRQAVGVNVSGQTVRGTDGEQAVGPAVGETEVSAMGAQVKSGAGVKRVAVVESERERVVNDTGLAVTRQGRNSRMSEQRSRYTWPDEDWLTE